MVANQKGDAQYILITNALYRETARHSARFYALRAARCADGSRPIPTLLPGKELPDKPYIQGGVCSPWSQTKRGMRSSFKTFRRGRNSEFIIYYLLSLIYNQYTTLPHFSAPYISPSFWVKIGQFFSVSPVAICLRCPYNRVITARALRMCFRSALFH